jgi:hypothetical protein
MPMTNALDGCISDFKEMLSPDPEFHISYGNAWCMYYALWLDYFVEIKVFDCEICPPDGVPTCSFEDDNMKSFSNGWASRFIKKIPAIEQQSEQWKYAKLSAMEYSSIRGLSQSKALLGSLWGKLAQIYGTNEHIMVIIQCHLNDMGKKPSACLEQDKNV